MIGESGRNLVFILSIPRSGSTLLGAILGNHSAVACPSEPWLLLRLSEVYADPAPGKIYDDFLGSQAVRAFITPEEFVSAARSFAREAYNSVLSRHGASLLVDKTPRYYHTLEFLDELFPEARKIWLKRNPLDIAASYKSTWHIDIDSLVGRNLVPVSFDFNLGFDKLSRYFAEKSVLKYEIRYEDLVASPEKEIRALADFCGIEYEPAMLAVTPASKGIRSLGDSLLGDPKIRSTSGINASSVGRWQDALEPDEIKQVVACLGQQVFIDWGYGEVTTGHPEFFDPNLTSAALAERREALVARFRTNSRELESKLRYFEQDHRRQDSVIAALHEECDVLRSSFNSLREENDGLQHWLKTVAQERDELHQWLKTVTQERDELQQWLKTVAQERDELQQVRSALTEERDVLTVERDVLLSRLDESQSTGRQLEERCRALEAALRDRENEVREYQQSYSYRLGHSLLSPAVALRDLLTNGRPNS